MIHMTSQSRAAQFAIRIKCGFCDKVYEHAVNVAHGEQFYLQDEPGDAARGRWVELFGVWVCHDHKVTQEITVDGVIFVSPHKDSLFPPGGVRV